MASSWRADRPRPGSVQAAPQIPHIGWLLWGAAGNERSAAAPGRLEPHHDAAVPATLTLAQVVGSFQWPFDQPIDEVLGWSFLDDLGPENAVDVTRPVEHSDDFDAPLNLAVINEMPFEAVDPTDTETHERWVLRLPRSAYFGRLGEKLERRLRRNVEAEGRTEARVLSKLLRLFVDVLASRGKDYDPLAHF
jgi:hypothetical protein